MRFDVRKLACTAALAALCTCPLDAAAQTPGPYDIMRNLASDSFATVRGAGISVQLPQGWTHAEDAGLIHFRVPYHAGVQGVVGTADVADVDAAAQFLTNRLGGDFRVERREPYTNGAFSGETAVLRGRPGGGTWMALAFVGTDDAGRHALFAMITPEAWFQTYRTVWMHALKTLG